MSDSAAYDQYATAADLYDGVPQYRERTDVAFFVDAAMAAGSPILEIGCGTGRVLIPTRLRETATMNGDVDVLGQFSWLDIWNHDRFLAKLQRDPFTDDDARALSEFGL